MRCEKIKISSKGRPCIIHGAIYLPQKSRCCHPSPGRTARRSVCQANCVNIYCPPPPVETTILHDRCRNHACCNQFTGRLCTSGVRNAILLRFAAREGRQTVCVQRGLCHRFINPCSTQRGRQRGRIWRTRPGCLCPNNYTRCSMPVSCRCCYIAMSFLSVKIRGATLTVFNPRSQRMCFAEKALKPIEMSLGMSVFFFCSGRTRKPFF